jgi:nucleotide-binding universal stress UspA family protein
MKILLAIDFSAPSEAVIQEVSMRLWPPDTVVIVLTVVDLFALTSSVGYLEPFVKNENDAARAMVEAVAERLESKGIETVIQVVEGYPAISIVEQATTWNVDFVFVGSHGHGGLARLFLGSVAKEVVRSAPCSVEIVRDSGEKPRTDGARRILIATDGSKHSETATQSVAQRSWPAATQVRILSVAELMIPLSDPWFVAGSVVEEVREQNVKTAQQAIATAVATITAAGLPAEGVMLTGNPKARILDEAREWGADILVVGSHGRRGLTRLLMGSVSEAIALHAGCSVEVIRSPEMPGKRVEVTK